jgi:DNA replication licensing factor MCM3
VYSIPFLKKYIEFAKNISPLLSNDAMEFIATEYSSLRNSEDRKKASALPVTARTLETIIRLSTAHAKARLSDEITVADCEDALDVLKFALEHDTHVLKKTRLDKRQAANADAMQDEEKELFEEKTQEDNAAVDDIVFDEKEEESKQSDDGVQSQSSAPARTASKRKQSKQGERKQQSKTQVDKDDDDMMDVDTQSGTLKRQKSNDIDMASASASSTSSSSSAPLNLSSDRIALFKRLLGRVMTERQADDEQVDILLPAMNGKVEGQGVFTRDEADHILLLLAAQNLVMYTDGRVWKI